MEKYGFWLFFISGFCILIIVVFFNKTWTEDLHKEYPEINFQDSIDGIVEKTFKLSGGIILIEVNKKKIRLYNCKNHKYDDSNLNEVLNEGDSIVKPAKTDSLFIFKSKKIYCFLLSSK